MTTRYISTVYASPYGRFTIVNRDEEAVIATYWDDVQPPVLRRKNVTEKPSELNDRWYDFLFGGRDIPAPPFEITGTTFQKAVYEATRNVAKGRVATYGEIARQIGKPKAFRAVAQALKANPLAIFVPCHRVVASGGMGGFNAGIERKRAILGDELSADVLNSLKG